MVEGKTEAVLLDRMEGGIGCVVEIPFENEDLVGMVVRIPVS